jgi:hypothetical protein
MELMSNDGDGFFSFIMMLNLERWVENGVFSIIQTFSNIIIFQTIFSFFLL